MTRKKGDALGQAKAETSKTKAKKNKFEHRKAVVIGPTEAGSTAPRIKYNLSKKHRGNQIYERHRRKKWYKVRFKNPGNDNVDFFYMISRMIILWYQQRIIDRISTEGLRKSLSIVTAINLVMGIISLIIGTTHFKGAKNLLVPYHSPIARSHYAGIAIMGGILTLFALFGFVGIYGKKMIYTKNFAVGSFINGYFLTTVYISWITQVYFVKTNFYNFQTEKKVDHVLDDVAIRRKATSDESDSLIYELIHYYMNIILLAAISQIVSGVLAIWLLVLHTEKQGYIPMYRRVIMSESSKLIIV